MHVSAAILAGGRATRFGGRDKGALIVGGRTIRDRQLEVLHALTDDVVIVGGADPRADLARHVPDLATACGPLGGLYTALVEAAHERVIVVACDMPFVTAALLAFLVESLGDADAVMPRTSRGLHPLCGVWSRNAIDVVADRLRVGRLKMRDLVAELRVHIVEGDALAAFGDPRRLLANVNTPADHAGLEGHEL